MKYTCRLFVKDDIPEIEKMMEQKRAKLGIDFWLPPLDDPRSLVLVYEADGKIIGAAVLRQVWDAVIVADDPRVMAAACEYVEPVREILKRRGIDQLVAWVPAQLLDHARGAKRGMQRLMERIGFRRIPSHFISFDLEV